MRYLTLGEAQELHRRIIQCWGVTVGAGGYADLRSTGDERHLMAIINLGAIQMTNRETGSGTMSDDLDGFLRLIWHGAHDGGLGRDSGVDAHVEIVQDVRGGQADLYFCSTGCLREFLNACVDELERTIAEAKSREDLNNRIQSNTR